MSEVIAHAAALQAAIDAGGPWIDPAATELAGASIDRTLERLRLGAGHTVVALVGATGSGKSSLFNSLASMDIAQVGARRPLTTLPMACIWGEDGSQDLLDWLDVPAERRVRRESVLDADRQASLHGLVLLDLPDHDSTEVVHRVEVDRLVTMVDLLIWVVDPQKYADDALHSGYLQRMTGHDSVMVVVLNQIDRLSPDEAEVCQRDLRRLLDGDGLESVRMLPVSATRGDGVDDLRRLLAEVVQHASVIEERLDADLIAAGGEMARGLAPFEPGGGEPLGMDRLVEQLAAAVGVSSVLEAMSAQFRRRSWSHTGWPVPRWLSKVGPEARGRLVGPLADADLKVIATSLMPMTAPSQRAQVELAVQAAIAANADPLPRRWAEAVRHGVTSERPRAAAIAGGLPPTGSQAGLGSSLDQAVASVDLQVGPPGWWRLAAITQFVCGLSIVVGALWLLAIGVSRVAGWSLPKPPSVLGIGLPLLILILGLVLGAVLAGLTWLALRRGAGRRQEAVREALYAVIRQVAEEQVGLPIREVLGRHRAARLALAGEGVWPSAVSGPTGLDGEVGADVAGGLGGFGATDGVDGVDRVDGVEGPGADEGEGLGADEVEGPGGVDRAEGFGGADETEGLGGVDRAEGPGGVDGVEGPGDLDDARGPGREAGSGSGPESGSHALTV